MKLKIIILLIIFTIPVLFTSCCRPQKISSVAVKMYPQHRDWWCWAATTEMISEHYGHRVPQCESANYIHGTPPDCCDEGCTGDCDCWGINWGATINEIKNNWSHWNFDYVYTPSVLSWEKLKKTISTSTCCDKSPVQVVWIWTGGGGHVVTAYGYAQIDTMKYVSYLNPWPPDCEKTNDDCQSVQGGEDLVSTYEAFVTSATRNWSYSFYNFKYSGQ